MTLQLILMKLLDVGPDLANLVLLFVKAKGKNSPGGKDLTDDEKAKLKDALDDLRDDLDN